jgi:hypothetical protein
MSALGGPPSMLGWAVALVIAIADGMVWSELGAALPGSGGSYRFLREGWLVEVDARRDCLALGARALAELRDTLRLALDDRCHLCQDVVVYGPVAEYKNGAERRLVDGRGAVLCAAACSPQRATPRPPRTCAAPPLAQKPARR